MGKGAYKMELTGNQLIQILHRIAPPEFAVEKDRIGLQVGDPNRTVRKILVTLDVTEEVVDEAIEQGCNWIVAHHALIFQPLKEIRTDRPKGRVLEKLIKHDIQVFNAHTNFDAAKNGVNDVLAELIGLQETKTLITYKEEPYLKLVVFVPESHKEKVRKALGDAGAGHIGNYSHCTFSAPGTGTFYPQEGSNPYLGQQGELEKVHEVRIETIIAASEKEKVIAAMLAAHPYEEVAYDLYPLANSGRPIGFGKVGNLPEAISLQELAEKVKKAYRVPALRMVGDPHQLVQRVALLGGSGSRYVNDARRERADVFITGDVDFHTAQDALADGISMLDPGHHIEYVTMKSMVAQLEAELASNVPVIYSQTDTNPFRFV